MRKFLISLIVLAFTNSNAQLNNRFFSNGNASRVAQLGAYGAVNYLQWRQIQATPTSTYNWSFSDNMVQSYHGAGLKLMITLSCTHPVNNDDVTSGTCANTFSIGGSD